MKRPRTPYFGENWNAPICDGAPQVATPVGAPCSYCRYPIEHGDQGMVHVAAFTNEIEPIHLECMVRNVVGSVTHQQGKHPCDMGEDTMTPCERRMAAIQAYTYFNQQNP